MERIRPRLPPVARGLIALQIVWVLLTAPLYPLYDLRIQIGAVRLGVGLVVLGAILGLSLHYRYRRTGDDARRMSEVYLVFFLMLLFTNIGSPSQYAAVAMAGPLIDPWLAAADQAMGVDVRALTAWTAGYPRLATALVLAYGTLAAQTVAAIPFLGLVKRDLTRLWELAFHFHLCLVVTLVALAFLPAECVFSHLGFESLIDQTRFIEQFQGFRSGAAKTIDFGQLEGMISMPSFHVAGGLMVTWALRGHGVVFAAVSLLNAAMLGSTVLCGAHYFVDLVATLALFALSVCVWRRLEERLCDARRGVSPGSGEDDCEI